jgi:glycosyltransferase involved in cell wall biosynthesis
MEINLSVIVPVYNGRATIERCLAALGAHRAPDAEIIVVDDGSTDDGGTVADRMGARVLTLPANSGPAAARNHGASHASGEVLLFVDSDVAVAADAVARVRKVLEANPDVSAVFGSYDMNPPYGGVVSRYKNLLHHFVHQNAETEASTFWAGCGAVRRVAFHAVGGFDHHRFRKPSIEDIDFGYRLRRAGHRVILDKTIQGTHLKAWTLRSLLSSDVMARAVPWSRMIAERREVPNDLNLKSDQRASAALVGLAVVALVLAPFWPRLVVPAGIALLVVIALNRRLYVFWIRRGGVGFTAAAVLLHWLYYLYSGLTYVTVVTGVRLMGLIPRSNNPAR